MNGSPIRSRRLIFGLADNGCEAGIAAISDSVDRQKDCNDACSIGGRRIAMSISEECNLRSWSALLASCRISSTCGNAFREAATRRGRLPKAAMAVNPILRDPDFPNATRFSSSVALSMSWRMCRASGRKIWPAGVSLTDRLVRSSSFTASTCSRIWICRLNGGCDMFMRSAARPKCLSSATVTKQRNRLISNMKPNPPKYSTYTSAKRAIVRTDVGNCRFQLLAFRKSADSRAGYSRDHQYVNPWATHSGKSGSTYFREDYCAL